MDTRIHQSKINERINAEEQREFTKDLILGEGESVMKIDQVKNDEKFLDSVVFNLCMKMQTQEQMQKLYFQKRLASAHGMFGRFQANYIHSSLFLPLNVFGLGYMWYRRRLTLNRMTMVLCFSVVINEIAKYQSCLKEDPQLGDQYKSYSQNYHDLFNKLCVGMNTWDIVTQVLEIDPDKRYQQTSQHYDGEAVHQVTFDLY